jgi:hypothetical protein
MTKTKQVSRRTEVRKATKQKELRSNHEGCKWVVPSCNKALVISFILMRSLEGNQTPCTCFLSTENLCLFWNTCQRIPPTTVCLPQNGQQNFLTLMSPGKT